MKADKKYMTKRKITALADFSKSHTKGLRYPVAD
jgi:hypothetical protein